jgi:ferredoxin
MKLDDIAQAAHVFGRGTVLFDDDLCVNVRGRKVICRSCAEACSPAVISVDIDGVSLRDEDCTDCGACVTACPVGAAEMAVFSPARFVEAAAGEETVHIHCSSSRDGGGGIVVPCMVLLDAELLAATRARSIVVHGLSRCDDCSRQAKPSLEAVTRLLARWFGAEAPEVRAAQPGEAAQGKRELQDQPKASRRSFLRFSGLQAATAAAMSVAWLAPIDPPQPPSELGIAASPLRQRPAVRRALLADVADSLPWQPEAPLPWNRRVFTEACNACLTCVPRCPTGALDHRHADGAREVLHHPGLCTSCGLCGSVCPQDAVRARPVRAVAELAERDAVLVRREVAVCAGCSQEFMAGDGVNGRCRQCGNERALDEDWLAMLEG